MAQFRVAYVGAGGTGRSSSASQMLAQLGRRTEKHSVAGGHHSATIDVDGAQVQVVATANHIRGWLAYNDPLEEGIDPRLVAEIDELPTYDGFVFVIDTREWRIEAGANDEAFAALRRDLASRSCDLTSVPVVFQANFRDQGDVCTMEWIRAHYRLPICAYTESVASLGIGVVDSVRELVRLILARSAFR